MTLSLVALGIWAVAWVLGFLGGSISALNWLLWIGFLLPMVAVLVLAIIALTFGIMGVSRAPALGGRGAALTGLIIGAVLVVLTIAAFVFLPAIVVIGG